MLGRLWLRRIFAAHRASWPTAVAAEQHDYSFCSSSSTIGNSNSSTIGNSNSSSKSSRSRDTLAKRLLSLVCPKRSAVVTLRKWVEEGKGVQKYELNRVVRDLRKHRRYKHALEICEWMTLQQDLKLLPGDYALHLDLVAKVRGSASAEKFFEDLPDRMKHETTCTSLLHNYVQNKLTTKAEALMDKMRALGFVKHPLPYNHMLTLYISTGQLEKVPVVIKELKTNTSPDIFTYNLWLSFCAARNDVKGAENVIFELKKENIIVDGVLKKEKINADWVTYSILTNIFIKSNLLEKAKDALKEMEKKVSRKDRAAYRSLMTLHSNLCNKDDVYRIWKNMQSLFRKLSDAEYTCMLSCLVKLGDIDEARKVFDEWDFVTGTRDTRVSNILLSAYVRNDMLEEAENFHEHTLKRGIASNYTTWETLALGYLSKMEMDKVFNAIEKAFSGVKKWEPNEVLIRAMFETLEILCDVEGAEKFLVILRNAGYVTTGIYNSLLQTYVRAGKMPLIVIERMQKDNVPLDEETRRLLRMTRELCVGEVSSMIS